MKFTYYIYFLIIILNWCDDVSSNCELIHVNGYQLIHSTRLIEFNDYNCNIISMKYYLIDWIELNWIDVMT